MEKEKEASASDVKVEADKVATGNNGGGYFADFDFAKAEINIDEMFKCGAHFGHHKSRKNPKMDDYIFGTRNGISIIDLEKTVEKLKEANTFIDKLISEGKDILFVGTKKQVKDLVVSAAKKAEMPYVVERWLGGTFTNYEVISKRTRFLRDGQEKMKRGEYAKYTKYEQMKIAEELEGLENKMGGIKNMMRLPGAIFVTGVIEDNLAIKEAKIKKIPVIALTDSNVNPIDVDYLIPTNEDAVSSLRLMIGYVVKTILESKQKYAKK
jgi:small subunit ribosomal protein S2